MSAQLCLRHAFSATSGARVERKDVLHGAMLVSLCSARCASAVYATPQRKDARSRRHHDDESRSATREAASRVKMPRYQDSVRTDDAYAQAR